MTLGKYIGCTLENIWKEKKLLYIGQSGKAPLRMTFLIRIRQKIHVSSEKKAIKAQIVATAMAVRHTSLSNCKAM